MSSFEAIPNPKTQLEKLFDEDQKDREDGLDKKDPTLFAEREKSRHQKAQEIFTQYEKDPQSLSDEGVYYLAFLFQHGQTSEDYKKAHQLALEAEKRGVEDAKWLTAATEDRHLLSVEKKQKWGTQFIRAEDGSQRLAPIEEDVTSGVTDEMRQTKNVPPRGS